MKFAHISDAHIGGWREPKMKQVNLEAYKHAIDTCLQRNVDFILIAGDLFNTALPAIELIHAVTEELKKVRRADIPVYIIPGSHDFSPSGKTMIDVLESAGLFTNVCKGQVINGKLQLQFTTDPKTGAKITGMIGKKGMLDQHYYEDLDRDHLECEAGYKIFMFHTALSELKPKSLEKMQSEPVSLLPKGFDYYAGGHVHYRKEFSSEQYKMVTQPGALFPNNFAELEQLSHGGFYIVEDDNVEWIPVHVRNHVAFHIDCDGKRPDDILPLVAEKAENSTLMEALVTLRFTGSIKQGRVSDIPFNQMMDTIYSHGAYHVMRNTAQLRSEEYEEVQVKQYSMEELEDQLIEEHVQQVGNFDRNQEIQLTKNLMDALSAEKKEGETTNDYEERLKKHAHHILNV